MVAIGLKFGLLGVSLRFYRNGRLPRTSRWRWSLGSCKRLGKLPCYSKLIARIWLGCFQFAWEVPSYWFSCWCGGQPATLGAPYAKAVGFWCLWLWASWYGDHPCTWETVSWQHLGFCKTDIFLDVWCCHLNANTLCKYKGTSLLRESLQSYNWQKPFPFVLGPNCPGLLNCIHFLSFRWTLESWRWMLGSSKSHASWSRRRSHVSNGPGMQTLCNWWS